MTDEQLFAGLADQIASRATKAEVAALRETVAHLVAASGLTIPMVQHQIAVSRVIEEAARHGLVCIPSAEFVPGGGASA